MTATTKSPSEPKIRCPMCRKMVPAHWVHPERIPLVNTTHNKRAGSIKGQLSECCSTLYAVATK